MAELEAAVAYKPLHLQGAWSASAEGWELLEVQG